MSKLEQIIKKLCMLVVDDMESIRSIVNSRLKGLGAEQIVMVGNGESVWNMPEFTGLELLGRV